MIPEYFGRVKMTQKQMDELISLMITIFVCSEILNIILFTILLWEITH